MKAQHTNRLRQWLMVIDRFMGAIMTGGLVLVLPVSLLLFLQWPLREVVHGFSREANDMAQVFFALYVSVAITYATRARAHLGADTFARRYSQRARARLYRLASLLIPIPWALFIWYAAWPGVVQSVLQTESFPDTSSPGYFIIRACACLLALLIFLQAVLDVFLTPETQKR
jgi:TRAP-type mannitol/chloroaromatic compound transport system permease small subunit